MISGLRTRSLWTIAAVIAVAGCDTSGPAHPAVGRVIGRLPIVPIGHAQPPPRLQGRVTLLNLWATWCGPCRMELPGLARLASRLADEPSFQLLAVSCGSDDPDEVARETRAYLEARQLPLAAWAFADPLARSLFASAHGLSGLPTTYLVGPDARVRRVWVGYRSRDEADMAAAIVELLKETTVEAGPR
jgi:thiol-disulfide isomerase/thioredoxin